MLFGSGVIILFCCVLFSQNFSDYKFYLNPVSFILLCVGIPFAIFVIGFFIKQSGLVSRGLTFKQHVALEQEIISNHLRNKPEINNLNYENIVMESNEANIGNINLNKNKNLNVAEVRDANDMNPNSNSHSFNPDNYKKKPFFDTIKIICRFIFKEKTSSLLYN